MERRHGGERTLAGLVGLPGTLSPACGAHLTVVYSACWKWPRRSHAPLATPSPGFFRGVFRQLTRRSQ